MSLKMREFMCSDDHVTEDLVEDSVVTLRCSVCGVTANRIMSAPLGWLTSPERRQAQLKKRSEDHARSKQGIDEARHNFEKALYKIEKKGGPKLMK